MLLKTNINCCLGLEPRCFSDREKDIDFLINTLSDTAPLSQKLRTVNQAVALCEKFHSYFHFEQSYFHTQLNKKHIAADDWSNAIQQLQHALKQDPLNQEALQLQSQSPNAHLRQEAFDHMQRYGIKQNGEYIRQLSSFADFLCFAELVFEDTYCPPKSYWHYCQQTLNIENLKLILEMLSENHNQYHHNAARIYYNRHWIYRWMHQEDMAANDLLRAQNLDPNI